MESHEIPIKSHLTKPEDVKSQSECTVIHQEVPRPRFALSPQTSTPPSHPPAHTPHTHAYTYINQFNLLIV